MQASLPAIVMDMHEEPVAAEAIEQENVIAQPVVTDEHSPVAPVRLAPQLETDAPEPAAQPSVAMAAPAEQDVPSSGEGGLLQWPDRGYTLQMLGARKAATIDKFIARQADPDAFHYFSTLYKGKPWHVVIYGRYDSRQYAAAAAQSLPAELRELQPWARSIESVKADIRKQRP